MIPTVEDVKTSALEYADDRAGAVFDPTLQTHAFNAAYHTLFDCFLTHEIEKAEALVLYALPAGTKSLLPSVAGITNFGEIIRMEERLDGSATDYTEVFQVDSLPQVVQRDTLVVYKWRDDTWFFVGATVNRQLRITYYASGQPPTSGSVGIDNCRLVLGKLTAYHLGQAKDRDLEYLKVEALGNKYEDQIIGGDMWRLIQPMVRSRQRVPVAPRPYRFGRVRRRAFGSMHVAANPVGTGAVIEFVISGAIDGTNGSDGNAVFTLNYVPLAGNAFHLFRNGVRQTVTEHFTLSGSTITFLAPFIPVAGDLLSATGQA